MRTRRVAASLAVALGLLAALETLARLHPSADASGAERNLLSMLARTPVAVCDGDDCRTDPALVALANPQARFRRLPAPGTARVVCVGGSTTAGWPFQPRGGYPEWLGAVLADVLPGRRVETINLGVSAWDGARLEPAFEQAFALGPSAVVARFGYNYYRSALLRRPRGGAPGRAVQAAWLGLFARSAAFRWGLRRLRSAAKRAELFRAPEILTPEEHRWIVEDHRVRLRALAARARAAGVPLVVLGLPHAPPMPRRAKYLSLLDELQAATRDECAKLGVPFAPLDDVLTEERFVDLIHSDLDGYRLTALAAARALAAAGFPEPKARWRWDKVAPRREHARRLGLDDPEFRAHSEFRVATMFLAEARYREAARRMEAALLAAPNPDLVPAVARNDGRAALADLYRKVFTRLLASGRVEEPVQDEHRVLAGLAPLQKL